MKNHFHGIRWVNQIHFSRQVGWGFLVIEFSFSNRLFLENKHRTKGPQEVRISLKTKFNYHKNIFKNKMIRDNMLYIVYMHKNTQPLNYSNMEN